MTEVAARAPLLPGIRVLRILWRMLPALAFAAVILACCWLLDASESIREQAVWIAATVIGFRLVSALVNEVLSPQRPGVRMLPMSDRQASRMATVVRGLLYVLLGTQIAIFLVRHNGWNESIASLVEMIRRTGLVLFTGLVIARTGLLAKVDVPEVKGYLDLLRRLFVRFVFPVGLLTFVVVTFVDALGYLAMAKYILRSMLGTVGAILAVTVVTAFLRKRLHRTIAFVETRESEPEAEAPRADQAAAAGDEPDDDLRDEDEHEDEEDAVAPRDELDEELDKLLAAAPTSTPVAPNPAWIGIEKLVEGTIQIVAVVAAVAWVMSIWGLETETVRELLAKQIIPGWGPTYGMIASALTYVGVTVLIGRAISTVLIFILFPRADVDAGARYAILAVFRYVTYFVAGYLGFAAVGFDTSALAVFAGAFGVALAFGLQEIFGNFLSGLIMLIERPVRVGDLIEVGGESGRVEAIRLRGTTIRTFEGTTIIIPNSQMLGERLKNISHDMQFARVQVTVGVSYSADPRRVQRVLLRVALRDRRVLRDPRPFVRFQAFGESSLDFLLNCYTMPDDRWVLRSDLHTAVFEALGRENIEIPFPQRDLHVRSSVVVDLPHGDSASPTQ